MKTCSVKVDNGLQYFLKKQQQKEWQTYSFIHKSTIRDVASGLGIPPPEIQVIQLNKQPANLGTAVKDNDCIRLSPGKLTGETFILDVHLGTLTRYLRMLGLDSYYRNDLSDEEIITIAGEEKRTVLTRDLGILKNSRVERGYFLRESDPREQLKEIIDIFNLNGKFEPFTRCMKCNGQLSPVKKSTIQGLVPEGAWQAHEHFYQCQQCKNIYWQGTHFRNMQQFIEQLKS